MNSARRVVSEYEDVFRHDFNPYTYIIIIIIIITIMEQADCAVSWPCDAIMYTASCASDSIRFRSIPSLNGCRPILHVRKEIRTYGVCTLSFRPVRITLTIQRYRYFHSNVVRGYLVILTRLSCIYVYKRGNSIRNGRCCRKWTVSDDDCPKTTVSTRTRVDEDDKRRRSLMLRPP